MKEVTFMVRQTEGEMKDITLMVRQNEMSEKSRDVQISRLFLLICNNNQKLVHPFDLEIKDTLEPYFFGYV